MQDRGIRAVSGHRPPGPPNRLGSGRRGADRSVITTAGDDESARVEIYDPTPEKCLVARVIVQGLVAAGVRDIAIGLRASDDGDCNLEGLVPLLLPLLRREETSGRAEGRRPHHATP